MKRIPIFMKILFMAAFLVPVLAAETEKAPSSRFSAAVQKDFIIVDAPHEYDFNPHTANYTNEAQLFTGLYEGLFSYDPYSLDPVPALAESYRESRDKKIWTFTIRKNATFSNGEPITAG